MSKLSETQKEECLNVMKKLSERSISAMFSFPVNPERDNCPNYFEIVTKPMDLSTVNEKLSSNNYATVSEWKSDIEQIWDNSFLYHKTNQLLRNITQEMQDAFADLTKFISDDPVQDWNSKLIFLRDQFITATKPYEIEYKNGKPVSSVKLQGVKVAVPAPKVQKTKKKTVNKKPLSRSGVIRLAKEINALTDDISLTAVIETLEEEEPNIKIEGEFLELNLIDLKPSTLILLRNKLESMHSQPQLQATQAQSQPEEQIISQTQTLIAAS